MNSKNTSKDSKSLFGKKDTEKGLFGKKGSGGLFEKDDDDGLKEADQYQPIDKVLKDVVDDQESDFSKRAKAERDRVLDANDTEYWCCMVFETRAQKDAFLEAMDWRVIGDKYLDGVLLAERQKIPLPASTIRYVKSKPDKKLDLLSQPLPE